MLIKSKLETGVFIASIFIVIYVNVLNVYNIHLLGKTHY